MNRVKSWIPDQIMVLLDYEIPVSEMQNQYQILSIKRYQNKMFPMPHQDFPQ